MNFGENLQTLRKQHDYSQEDLAERLGVSRQAVSKWESGTGLPETEKLLQLCEVFGCSLDTLLKGKVSIDEIADKKTYEMAMDKYNKYSILAKLLGLMGITVMLFIIGYTLGSMTLGVMVFFLFAAVASPFKILAHTERENLKRKYPQLPQFYTEAEVIAAQNTYVKTKVMARVILFIGVIVTLFMYSMRMHTVYDAVNGIYGTWYGVKSYIMELGAVFFVFVTIATAIKKYGRLHKDKYDMNTYNKDEFDVLEYSQTKVGKYCTVIMMSATILFFISSSVFKGQSNSGVIFPIAGLLCGMVSLWFGQNEQEQK